MVWHILRKDLRLMWPLVTLVAVLQFACAGIHLALGHFADPPQLVFVADVLSGATFIGAALLIISAIQQDCVPGVNQDWLVRPIRRGDLVAAKLLFLVVAVHGPMLAADIARATLASVPAGGALTAALSRSAVLFLSFDLPIAALATVTATAIEAIGAVLVIWLMVLAGLIVGSALRGGAPSFAGSGLQWMMPAYWSLLALTTAAIVIPLQYFRRTTAKARRIVLGAVLLAPLLSFTSWSAAFAVQERFLSDPAATAPISIAFDPQLGKATSEGLEVSRGLIALPLRVSGLVAGSVVRNDRAMVRLVGPAGETLYAGPSATFASQIDDFPVRATGTGDVRAYELIALPAKVLDAVGGRPVRLEIDYSLTLLRSGAAGTMPAVGGDERIGGFGWCKSRTDDEGDDVVIGCLKSGRVPDCIAGTLQESTTGLRNPENYLCRPDYSPLVLSYLDTIHQFDGELEFRDPKGLAKYPVNAALVARSQVILASFRPRAHFTRRLVVARIRLNDWAS